LALLPESFWTIDLWNASQLRARDTFIAQTAAFALITLFRVALLLSGAGVVAFAWCIVAERAAAAAGLVVRYAKSGERLRAWAVSSRRARALLRKGWPLMMNLVMVTIYMRSDAIMLGALLGDGAVGIYSAAVQISEFWYFLPAAFVSSATPALLQARSVGRAHYRQRVLLLLEVLSIMSVAVALTLTFFSGPVVTLLFGQEYAAAGPVLAVHAWTSVFVLHGQARATWLIAEGYQRLGVVTTSLGAIVNIALNAILIPREGPVGAAIATLCAQFIAAAGGNALFAETRGFAMLQIRSLLPMQIWKQLRHREGSADDP
jgi:PST family polysaccharide transporter